jgi:hypothetical protein
LFWYILDKERVEIRLYNQGDGSVDRALVSNNANTSCIGMKPTWLRFGLALAILDSLEMALVAPVLDPVLNPGPVVFFEGPGATGALAVGSFVFRFKVGGMAGLLG